MAGLRPLLRRPLQGPLFTRLTSSIPAPTPFVPRNSRTNPLIRIPRPSARFQSQWNRPPPRSSYVRFGRGQRLYGLWKSSREFRYGAYGVAGLGGWYYWTHLEQVPVSGRWRFMCVSPQTAAAVSQDQVKMILQEYRGRVVGKDHRLTVMVREVLERLIPASNADPNTKWELYVIDDPKTANAFVAPGGKVFVYTGILPICQDEDGVAAVLGHEIAHNVAHHVEERMSKMWFLLGASFLLSYVADISAQVAQLVVQLALELPNSRTSESEADHIGLLIMARACYNPQAAVALWQRMGQQEGKNQVPQFISTHPSSGSRSKAIEKWVPEAQAERQEAGCARIQRIAPQFRKAIGYQESPRDQSRDDDDGYFF